MIKKGDLYYPSEESKKDAWLNDPSIYSEAAQDPIKFWEKLAEGIFWQKKWDKAFVHQPPYFQWFTGGKLNITENCLDRNLEKNKDKIALIWEPEPIEEASRKLTYQELFYEVNKLSNALKKLGVKKGDRVGIYLPMVPEIIFSMLACARIGAVHAVVFSAFSPNALKARLQDTEAKILITADGYYRRGKIINLKENADEGIKETQVEKLVVVKRTKNEISWNPERDIWYDDLVKNESDSCPAEIMDSENLLFILYTSGSTGKPKGTMHTCGGYTVQAYWTAKWIFDLKDNDIFWSTADLGWITGHTYSCYGQLLNASTFVIFEGVFDFPTPDRWAQIIEKHKITIFYTAPTAIRMLEKYGSEILKKYQSRRYSRDPDSTTSGFETLRLLGSVGEPIDEAAWQWYFQEVGKGKLTIIDTWWQTETGGILITSLPGIGPFKPAFTGLPLPSIKVNILDEQGKPCSIDEEGNLVILPPFSPGLLRGIYKNEKKYLETYWSQCGDKIYFTSDGALMDKNGLIRVVGRVDDVIKVAGHRVATGELEAIIDDHKDITECAVIGIPDEIKGEVPIAFVVSQILRQPDELKQEVIDLVRKDLGAVISLKEVYVVDDLPKTRSGKIMRRILKKLLTNEDLGDLSTLANPESVEKIRAALSQKI